MRKVFQDYIDSKGSHAKYLQKKYEDELNDDELEAIRTDLSHVQETSDLSLDEKEIRKSIIKKTYQSSSMGDLILKKAILEALKLITYEVK